jgi:uncharacterized protein YbjT (DUF2867 family)
VLSWSTLPVVQIRPTVFLQTILFLAAGSIVHDGTIRLPFGDGRTAPVDVDDVADVIVAVLADPGAHVGRVYELTGARSQTLQELAAEFAAGLGRPIRYVDIPAGAWHDELLRHGVPAHLVDHLSTVARLNTQGRYDRMTRDVERLTGHPATTATEFAERNAHPFSGSEARPESPR